MAFIFDPNDLLMFLVLQPSQRHLKYLRFRCFLIGLISASEIMHAK